MGRPIRLSTLAIALAGLLAAAGTAAAAPRFDGSWSVLVVTESGTCDRAYRYPVRVENGAVSYQGEAGIDLSGKVSPNGAVQVTIRRGEQSASGSGRLSASGGSGKWSGKSPTSECSGSWQAERRAPN